ncbi:uncharacterized protein LOC7474562 isoform X5 [Populus trichocarpa]|nr:uncharacterized protein LOC7474562 isoform X5 [Populus trichocarpa]XP_024451529.1 uncharacterized protein LOC7474562 isoform X5 [Populus trichocarpa]XP_024451530.1 uncharacterized protein LOC7474562 isoform X5 [Populus trichocarpa]|eukprot:XP_024451527.1 uncharacterized protein LOC7474562 isoform X3 [Populus trichocarpa]
MRHRLDSKGQRKGKVIDYREWDWNTKRVSYPCFSRMWNYFLFPGELAHPVSCDADDKQEAKAYSKDLSSYCGRLLEETEDELAELIKKGSVKVGRLSKILCQDLSKHCKQSSDSHEVDADDDEPDGEL